MEISYPIKKEDINQLKIGDEVKITGKVFTARDAAHERILERKEIPFSLDNSIIYHCGPLVKKQNNEWEIISAGPTTSTRLSKYIPPLLRKHKIRVLIGKGGLEESVISSLEKNNCVYLSYTGGAAALASKSIKKVLDVHWLDLGIPEAVWELEIKQLPCIVSIDAQGNSLYNR